MINVSQGNQIEITHHNHEKTFGFFIEKKINE